MLFSHFFVTIKNSYFYKKKVQELNKNSCTH